MRATVVLIVIGAECRRSSALKSSHAANKVVVLELLALRISPIPESKMSRCVPSTAIIVLFCCPTSNGGKMRGGR
jgi:hypothetical protein